MNDSFIENFAVGMTMAVGIMLMGASLLSAYIYSDSLSWVIQGLLGIFLFALSFATFLFVPNKKREVQ